MSRLMCFVNISAGLEEPGILVREKSFFLSRSCTHNGYMKMPDAAKSASPTYADGGSSVGQYFQSEVDTQIGSQCLKSQSIGRTAANAAQLCLAAKKSYRGLSG